MKKIFKTLAALLLLINGIGAIYGGCHLMRFPDGSSLQMPLEMLKYAPFSDCLIPSIILFTANGLNSLIVLVSLLVKLKRDPWLIMGQGVILSGWIVIQCMVIQAVHFLHFLFGTVGLLLMLIAWMILRLNLLPLKNQKPAIERPKSRPQKFED